MWNFTNIWPTVNVTVHCKPFKLEECCDFFQITRPGKTGAYCLVTKVHSFLCFTVSRPFYYTVTWSQKINKTKERTFRTEPVGLKEPYAVTLYFQSDADGSERGFNCTVSGKGTGEFSLALKLIISWLALQVA